MAFLGSEEARRLPTHLYMVWTGRAHTLQDSASPPLSSLS